MQVAVLNGVNLDVLGRAGPGRLRRHHAQRARDADLRVGQGARLHVRCRQTNNEGDYVAWCHDALDWANGVIVNPGAWSHYSYAISDALELLTVPVVEVHLSNLEEREEWRRHSVIADLAAKRVIGKGPDGYREALEYLAERP